MAFDLDDAGGVELDFEGTEYDGLQVRMRQTSVGGLLDLAAVADHLDGLKGGESPAELSRRLHTVLEPLAALLASWSLTQGGQPVPADLDGLLRLPPALLGRIISSYVTAQAQAPPPLPDGSSDGPTTDPLEASIPMTPMTASPPS
jgi:hypothetical protein